MKTIYKYLFCCTAILTVAMHAMGLTSTYQMDISSTTLEIDSVSTDEGIFSTLRIDGLDTSMTEEEPMLPVQYVTVKVPTYTNGFSASVASASAPRTYNLGHPVLPFKDAVADGSESEISYLPLTGQGYSSPTSAGASIASEFFLNGSEHFVKIAISPVAYDYADSELIVYDRLTVTLQYQNCDVSEMAFTPLFTSGINTLYDTAMLDHYEIKTDGAPMTRANTLRSASTDYAYSMVQAKHYIILAPENLVDGVSDLAVWKRQKGYQVTVETYENILAMPKYQVGASEEVFDRESGIREWMRDFYRDNGTFFCLLIGDYRTSAPIRKYDSLLKPVVTEANSQRYVPSDVYYSDLVSNWDFYFSEAGIYTTSGDKFSFCPTVATGRLLCFNQEEIRNFIRKLIIYESFPGNGVLDYLNHGVLVEDYDNSTMTKLDMFQSLSCMDCSIWQENHAETYDELSPVPKDVIDDMGTAGIISIQCHAGPSAWVIATVKDSADKAHSIVRFSKEISSPIRSAALEQMDNHNSPAVLYSVGCNVAPFDSLLKYDSSTKTLHGYGAIGYNLGSAYTVAGKFGGPAALVNTRYGFIGASPNLEYAFGKALKTTACCGIAENISKMQFYDGSISNKSVIIRHNIIGDPEFTIWLGAPNTGKSYTTQFSNSIFSVSTGNNTMGWYAYRVGDWCDRQVFSSNRIPLSISLQEAITKTGNEIGVVWFQPEKTLPLISLVTTGNTIMNTIDSFQLIDCKLAQGGKASNEFTPYLIMGEGADITINTLTDINSDSGIKVSSGALLKLNAEERIILANDIVSKGGKLEISANEITINAGTSFEKGSEVTLNPWVN